MSIKVQAETEIILIRLNCIEKNNFSVRKLQKLKKKKTRKTYKFIHFSYIIFYLNVQ